MVARIVVLAIPSQAPAQGVVRPQFSTERSWFKVSRFCYVLMKYSCDRRAICDCNLYIILVICFRLMDLRASGLELWI